MADKLPAYQVRELEGTRKKTIYEMDKKTKTLREKEVEVDKGYMVFFPRGHSIHVETEAELRRLGFHRKPNEVTPGDEADLEEPRGPDLEELNRRVTRERAVDLDVAE